MGFITGYKSGHENATRDGDKAVSELQSAFDTYKTEQATLENAALRAWAKRYQEQVAAGQQAEASYLEQIAQLESQNKQLQGQINDVTQRWIDEKVRAIPLSACLLAVSCASTTPRSDMTTHPSTPVIQTQLPPLAPALAQRPGNLKPLTRLRNSGVSQRDVLANIIDNAKQCRIWRSQINGMLDEREGLQK